MTAPGNRADRNLLFGILALQMDFISRDALVQAMHAWVLEKSRPLGEILLEQKHLSADRHSLLEALVQEHLKQHNHDPQQSLAAVSSLTSIRPDLQGLADADVDATLALVSAARTKDSPNSNVATTIGVSTSSGDRFVILRPHAKGGLGQVSVARDQELNREVALKEIQPALADDPGSRARFLLEAEVTGGLEHPGIVPVYGLGQYDDGRPFYAMRFIRGNSLKEAIDQFHGSDEVGRSKADDSRGGLRSASSSNVDPSSFQSLSFRKLLQRFIDVCNAIDYAHSRGVLHRDLKPGNIMLGKYGETLVVDWGLAKVIGRAEAMGASDEPTLKPFQGSRSTRTYVGCAIGTPSYMSPEQAAGRVDQLGTATDVYSLGAVLYCILTAERPLEGLKISALLDRIQTGDIPAPRARNPCIPKALEAICLKAMSLCPGDRYSAVSRLADDIECWLADEAVTAFNEPVLTRIGRFSRKHRTFVSSAGVLMATAILALTAGLVAVSREQQRTSLAQQATERQRKTAVNEKREADRQRTFANQERDKAQFAAYRAQVQSADSAWSANQVDSARFHLNSCEAKLRGWEHAHLRAKFSRGFHKLNIRAQDATTAAMTLDGSRLVLGTLHGEVRFIELQFADGQNTASAERIGRAHSTQVVDIDGQR